MSAEVCSPSHEENFKKNKTCFSRAALIRLIEAWNASAASPTGTASGHQRITGYASKPARVLWRLLNEKMQPQCGSAGATREGCWVDTLLGGESDALRPKKPKEWYKEPFTWLTNFDIEAVMEQYDASADPDFNYRFLGVYPIDFAGKSAFGTCLFNEICALRVAPLIKQGIKYLGLITNLDRHDQGGSHWTSLFVILDPSNPAYGAYYYDSVGRKTPPEVQAFAESIRDELAGIYPARDTAPHPFRIDYNKNQHQHANTECGIFSMAYQIRWLRLLNSRKRKPTTFEEVVNINITDKDVHHLRDILYRPSPS